MYVGVDTCFRLKFFVKTIKYFFPGLEYFPVIQNNAS